MLKIHGKLSRYLPFSIVRASMCYILTSILPLSHDRKSQLFLSVYGTMSHFHFRGIHFMNYSLLDMHDKCMYVYTRIMTIETTLLLVSVDYALFYIIKKTSNGNADI
jgi:hypothetical protein